MTKANEEHICPCFKTINVLTADFSYTLYRIMSENREEENVEPKEKKGESERCEKRWEWKRDVQKKYEQKELEKFGIVFYYFIWF